MSELLTTHGLARFLLDGPDAAVTYDYGESRAMRAEWTESTDGRFQAFLATEPDWNPPDVSSPPTAGEGNGDMADIEARIKQRSYQTPGRARAAIKMSPSIKGKERARLEELVDAWENEGSIDAVVGGVPAGEFVELSAGQTLVLDPPAANGRTYPQLSGSISDPPDSGSVVHAKMAPVGTRALSSPLTVSLNARVRARLTPYGVSLLYAARSKVAVPEDLMAKQGVWEVELWQFMLVMGEHLSMGDAPVTEKCLIDLITR